MAEATKTAMELLEDNGLSLNFTDLFSDDPLGHLLKYNKTLLYDFNLLRVTDKLFFIDDGLAEVLRAVEIANTVEVVEAIKRRNSAPFVKRV